MKPTENIEFLIKNISVQDNIQAGRKRQIITMQQYREKVVIIVHSGSIAVYRSHDHMLLSNGRGPIIVGMNFCVDSNPEVYIQAQSDIQFEMVTMDYVLDMVKEKNLWEHACYFAMYLNLKWRENHFGIAGVSTYNQICNCLINLLNEPEEFRLKTNIAVYIHERTLLSRSGIMKVLSELKSGDYIDIEKGVLKRVNKLPMNY